MKKGNVTILASIFIMALVAAGVGAGTMAYFSSTEKVGITFTAGTPDLVLSFDASTWTNGLTKSFPVWAPGDKCEMTVYTKNIGDIGLAGLYVTGNSLWVSKAGLGDQIFITKVGYTDRQTDGSQFWVYPAGGTYYADINRFGGDNGKLSLTELASGYADKEYMKFSWGGTLADAYYHGDYLPAYGAMIQAFKIEFTFDKDADITWQGTSCSFDLVFIGTDTPFIAVWVP